MKYNKGLKNKVYGCGITIKFEKKESDVSLKKTSFFDALQQVNFPFKKEPDTSYQEYPLCQEVTLSLFEKETAKTSIKYDPDQEKIIIEEHSDGYQSNKGEALMNILEHIMINHGNHHSFFIVEPRDLDTKRKTTHSM
jgi:hypothetical protein